MPRRDLARGAQGRGVMTVVDAGMQWLALLLACAVVASAIGAIVARSLFSMCMYLLAAGALAAAVVLLLGAGEGALALALFAAAWAPVLLLAAMLLSARAVKPMRRGRPWLSMGAATVSAGAILWPAAELGARAAPASEMSGLGFWLAPLIFATAAACLGLLGYGERGALGRGPDG